MSGQQSPTIRRLTFHPRAHGCNQSTRPGGSCGCKCHCRLGASKSGQSRQYSRPRLGYTILHTTNEVPACVCMPDRGTNGKKRVIHIGGKGDERDRRRWMVCKALLSGNTASNEQYRVGCTEDKVCGGRRRMEWNGQFGCSLSSVCHRLEHRTLSSCDFTLATV